MAGFTEEQFREAARKAYQDGNVESAQRLIAQARQAGMGSTPAPAGGSSVNAANMQGFERGASDMAQTANNFVTGAANGATLGFGDNIAAGIGGIDSMVRGNGFKRGYDSTLEITRDGMAEAQRESPVAYGAGNVAGAIPAAVGGGLAAQGGKTLLQQGARLGGLGAAEGGAIGAGNADGENVMGNAATGAAIGAGLGVAAKPVADGIRATGRAMSAPMSGLFNAATGRGSQTRANSIAQRALERSGKSLEEVQSAAMQAAEAGQPMAVADLLGSPGQGALNGAARVPGQAQRELTEFLESRQLGAPDRMRRALAEGLDTPDTAAQRTAALTADRSATAKVNYDAARNNANPVDVRGALGVLDGRLGQTAGMEGTGFTGDGIDSVFSRYRNRLAADRVPSDVDAIELSDFDRVLGVKQDMQDDIQAATRAGRNNEARELDRVVSELDKALEFGSDGYRAANDTYARQSGDIRAVAQGTSAAKSTRRAEDVIDEFRALPSPERQSAFRSGMADPFMARIGNAGEATDVTRPIRTPDMQAILGEVAVDPAKLQAQIGREQTMFQTGKTVLGGSQTFNNAADAADNQAIDVGFLANLLTNPKGAAIQAGQKAANVATNQTEGTNQLLARILMSQNPEEAFAPAMAQQGRQQNRSVGLQALMRQIGQQSQASR